MKVQKKKKILVNPFALSKDLSFLTKKATPNTGLSTPPLEESLANELKSSETKKPKKCDKDFESDVKEISDGEVVSDEEADVIFLKEEKSPGKIKNSSSPGQSIKPAPLIDLTKDNEKPDRKDAGPTLQKYIRKFGGRRPSNLLSYNVKRKISKKKKKKGKMNKNFSAKNPPIASNMIEELSKQLMQLPVFSNMLKKIDEKKGTPCSPEKAPVKKNTPTIAPSPPPSMRVNSFRPKDTVYRAPGYLRPIVVDASNVAFAHGNNKLFSVKGIRICVDFFLQRGHRVVAFLPMFRSQTSPKYELQRLEEEKILIYTPSRNINGYQFTSYDDRFIVQYADENGGVIISRDNFRDLRGENSSWRYTIDNRLLMYTFIGDTIMFPFDPLGKKGPHLDEFLRFPSGRK